MARLKRLRTDPVAEEKGAWCTFYEDPDGAEAPIRFLIARITTQKCSSAIAEACREHRAELKDPSTGQALKLRLMAPAIAEHVLLGWSGVQDDSGAEVPYSKAAAVEVLLDPAYHDVYEFILAAAARASTFRATNLEESAKN